MYKFAIISAALLTSSMAHASEVYDDTFGCSHLRTDRTMIIEARKKANQEAAANNARLKRALSSQDYSLVNGHLVQLTDEMLAFLNSHFTDKEISQKVIRGGCNSSSGEEN